MPENFGEQFLHNRNPELHKDPNVEHEMHRKKDKGEKVTQKPADKLADWLHVLERTHIKHREDPKVMERIKNYYHKNHIIKEENIPQSYWDSQGEMIARDGRLGDLQASGVAVETINDEDGNPSERHFYFPENMKHEQAEVLIADQKSTLDNWIDYFTSPDSDSYPMWSKYWAFTGMLKLSSYDKEKHSFGRRDKTTVAPFPDLDREALAYTVDYLVKKYGEENIQLQTDIKVLQSQLQKMEKYDKQLRVVETGEDAQGNSVKEEVLEQMKQKLKKPDGYDDRKELQGRLQELLQKQDVLLGNEERTDQGKDILVTEEFGKLYAYAIEKVIPAEANELLNTQGIWVTFSQDSDPMTYVPEGFNEALVPSLQGHGTGWCTAGETTAREQLKGGDFHIYYSHDKSGQSTVPRVAIRMENDKIAEVRGIAHEQNLDPYIGEVVEEKMLEFGGEGEAYTQKARDMQHLTEIEGKHKFGEELSNEDLRFLYGIDRKIKGFGYETDPRIDGIIESRNSFREDIARVTGFREEEISLNKKEALRGGVTYHFGDLNLQSLQSAEGLKLPQTIGRSLNLNWLQSAEGLKLPQAIGGSLLLRTLQSAEGLQLPQVIKGNLYLSNLQSAEGLKLPETVGGSVILNNLSSVEMEELRRKYPSLDIV